MRNTNIKTAIAFLNYEDGKNNEIPFIYDAGKTMLQNAREILREIKNNNYFRTLKLDNTKPEVELLDECVKAYTFYAVSSKGYDITAEICFYE